MINVRKMVKQYDLGGHLDWVIRTGHIGELHVSRDLNERVINKTRRGDRTGRASKETGQKLWLRIVRGIKKQKNKEPLEKQ